MTSVWMEVRNEDERDLKEWIENDPQYKFEPKWNKALIGVGFLEGRKTLREKMVEEIAEMKHDAYEAGMKDGTSH